MEGGEYAVVIPQDWNNNAQLQEFDTRSNLGYHVIDMCHQTRNT